MAYTPTNWINGQTSITADKLNKMEKGIKDLHDEVPIGPSYESVTLTLMNDRLKDFSYVCRYYPYLRMVFLKMFGNTNETFNEGYKYNLASIQSGYRPNSVYPAAVKCLKNVDITFSADGTVDITPKEAVTTGYDLYVEGFWFL